MAHFVVNVTSRYVIIVMDRVRISVGNRVRVWFMVRFGFSGFFVSVPSTNYVLCATLQLCCQVSLNFMCPELTY